MRISYNNLCDKTIVYQIRFYSSTTTTITVNIIITIGTAVSNRHCATTIQLIM